MEIFDMELTQRQAQEYKRATKTEKGEILNQYCKLTDVTRNLASKRFRVAIRNLKPRVLKVTKKKRKAGRKAKYTNLHKAIIGKAWKLSREICGERLHPVLSEYVLELKKSGELKYFGKRYIVESMGMSERTLKRIISKFPRASKKRYKGNSSIYKAIPINAYFGRNADKPGYVEIDYVEHNGGNSKGGFANTGCYVDVHLGWLARSASLGKSMNSVGMIHDIVENKIYHMVHEYHPDNAKPILKLLLERKMDSRKRHYAISRSRPYHKEDNGHVEQKNGDKIRKLVGYHRYDTDAQVNLLNGLYEVEDKISNFFIPSQKLLEKEYDDMGRLVSRKHDKAKTAYSRLMGSPLIAEEVKKKVEKIRKGLSLIELRKQSDELQKHLFSTVC